MGQWVSGSVNDSFRLEIGDWSYRISELEDWLKLSLLIRLRICLLFRCVESKSIENTAQYMFQKIYYEKVQKYSERKKLKCYRVMAGRCLVIDSFALKAAALLLLWLFNLTFLSTPDHHQSTSNHQSLIVSTWLRKLAKNRVIVNTSRSLANFQADENIQATQDLAQLVHAI